jgi:hypothetical protein
VDYPALVKEATLLNERPTLGLFLELAGSLGHDRLLVERAQGLQDRRRAPARRMFFDTPLNPYSLQAARNNTPAVARRWGFLMNMPLDSFASAFGKHVALV